MVNDNLKCIFIHIPKTAGTSIVTAFGEVHTTAMHDVPIVIKGRCAQEQWNAYFKFTFIRNPWDRFVSAFYYGKERNDEFGSMPYTHDNQFRAWLYSKAKTSDSAAELLLEYKHWPSGWGYHHFLPQTHWFKDITYNFVGMYEHLEEDYNLLCKELGVSATLSKMRASTHPPYRDCVSKDLVAELYKEDIEYFGSYEY